MTLVVNLPQTSRLEILFALECLQVTMTWQIFVWCNQKNFLITLPLLYYSQQNEAIFRVFSERKKKKDPFQTYSFRIFSSRLLFFWMAKQKKLRFYFDIWQPFLFQNFWYKFIPLLSLFSSTFPFQFQLFLSLFMLHVYKKIVITNFHQSFVRD